jgi:hypothetical protein
MRPAALALVLTLTALSAAAQPGVMANAPVKFFKLPILNQAGVRTSLLRGNEARYISATQIDLIDMQYTTFVEDGSNRVEATLLAPVASVLTQQNEVKVHGDETVRFIRDDVEVTGSKWTYDRNQKKISIDQDVRVLFRAELKGLLK